MRADDFLRTHYAKGCRQLVLLGAGMDARAYRMGGLDELRVFEVDQKTTFDVKEPWCGCRKCVSITVLQSHPTRRRLQVHHAAADEQRVLRACARGIGLRCPRFMREREDKPAEHATAHTQIIDMYFEQQSVET